MSHHHPIICKNCENSFNGHFCNNCGQKAQTHRIDLKHVLHDLLHAVTHIDKGLFYTAKMMITQPGITLRAYIKGKRIHHPNPLLMVLIIGGLCSLTYYNLELRLISSFKISELDGGLHAIDSKFFAILYLSYSLLLSLIDFILFRFKGYNYTELFTVNIFISLEILLAQLCLVPIWLIGKSLGINDYIRVVIGLVYVFYLIYVKFQFFEVKGDKKSEKRMILAAILLLLFYILSGWKNFHQLYSDFSH